MQPLKWLGKLARSERGNAILICAATLPLVIGAAAAGVDTIQATVAQRQLQRAADSAAIAGAYAKLQNQTVTTAVDHDLALNSDMTLSIPRVVQNAPTSGPYSGNNRAVRVVLTAERAVPFMAFFTGEPMTITAEATAMSVYTGQYCMVSLDTTNVTGVNFTGNTNVNLGCGVVANSPSANAITADGSAVVNASPVAAVGNVPSSTSYSTGTVLLPYSPAQVDPWASLPMPSVPANCQNQYSYNGQQTPPAFVPTTPGGNVYCYRGMNFQGQVAATLPANSVFIIDGGTNSSNPNKLDFGAQANVTGSGVTFLLTSSAAATSPGTVAEISMNGGAQVNLTAPATGTYAGVLMYMDRRAPSTRSSTVNGNSASTYQGGLYFPSHQLTFNGTTGMNTQCIQLVARRLSFSGNSHVSNTCPANGGAHAWDYQFIRLVG